jgi:hypothetical protein
VNKTGFGAGGEDGVLPGLPEPLSERRTIETGTQSYGAMEEAINERLDKVKRSKLRTGRSRRRGSPWAIHSLQRMWVTSRMSNRWTRSLVQ